VGKNEILTNHKWGTLKLTPVNKERGGKNFLGKGEEKLGETGGRVTLGKKIEFHGEKRAPPFAESQVSGSKKKARTNEKGQFARSECQEGGVGDPGKQEGGTGKKNPRPGGGFHATNSILGSTPSKPVSPHGRRS